MSAQFIDRPEDGQARQRVTIPLRHPPPQLSPFLLQNSQRIPQQTWSAPIHRLRTAFDALPRDKPSPVPAGINRPTITFSFNPRR